jgi:hypothetical protein
MSRGQLQHLFAYAAVLAVAVLAGLLLTNRVQRAVPLLPGVRGCERLATNSEQTRCIARHFQGQLDERAAGASAGRRAQVAAQVVAGADRLAARDADLSGMCHSAMHVVGRAEGARTAAAGGTVRFPPESQRLCTAGYVHGLAEGYLEGSTRPDVAAVFPKLCSDPDAVSGCAHGIGHALLRGTPTVAPASVPAALDGCHDLPVERLGDCSNGVFMELTMTEPPVSTARYAGTCRSTSDPLLRESCFAYLALSASVNELPASDVPGLCREHAGADAGTCVEAFGRGQGTDGIGACARAGSDSLVARCLRGALALQLDSGHITLPDALEACAGVGGARATCERTARELAA